MHWKHSEKMVREKALIIPMKLSHYLLPIRYFFVGFIIFGLTLPVSAADQKNQISCLGQIVGGERTMIIAAPERSVLGRLLVKRSDRVSRGAELARLRDYDEQAAAVDCARREIAVAEAGLALIKRGERPDQVEAQRAIVTSKEAAVRRHQARKDRYAQLHARAIVPDDAYETIEHDFVTAKAELLREKNVLEGMLSGYKEEIRQAAARVALAEANHRREIARLEAQRIRAPIAGKILSINAYPGESIGERGILDLADTENMMIVAEVYETDIARVRIGSRARFRSAVFPGEIGGTVVEIERKVETGRIYALDPRHHADRRIVMVRIKPDASARLASFSHAQVTVILNTP